MQALIRLNLSILLSLVTLSVLAFIALVGWTLLEAYQTSRFFQKTTCATMLADLKSQDSAAAERYGNAFQKTADSLMEEVDKELYQSKLTFQQFLRGCFQQPKSSLHDILVSDQANSVAAKVTDLYNTIDGELKVSPTMYSEPSINEAKEDSRNSTAPTSGEGSAMTTEPKGPNVNTPFPAGTKPTQPKPAQPKSE